MPVPVPHSEVHGGGAPQNINPAKFRADSSLCLFRLRARIRESAQLTRVSEFRAAHRGRRFGDPDSKGGEPPSGLSKQPTSPGIQTSRSLSDRCVALELLHSMKVETLLMAAVLPALARVAVRSGVAPHGLRTQLLKAFLFGSAEILDGPVFLLRRCLLPPVSVGQCQALERFLDQAGTQDLVDPEELTLPPAVVDVAIDGGNERCEVLLLGYQQREGRDGRRSGHSQLWTHDFAQSNKIGHLCLLPAPGPQPAGDQPTPIGTESN